MFEFNISKDDWPADPGTEGLIADWKVSVGDFVLTCGEIPAMVLINGLVRLLPGTVGSPESLLEESHCDGLLEHPHYTRPPDFRGLAVPDVLRSGNHAAISAWRKEQQEIRTRDRRPDLYHLWIKQQKSLGLKEC